VFEFLLIQVSVSVVAASAINKAPIGRTVAFEYFEKRLGCLVHSVEFTVSDVLSATWGFSLHNASGGE